VTPPDRFDVLTVGEAMVLLAAREAGALEDIVDFTRYSAGAELNVAIGLARLGLRVGYLSGASCQGCCRRRTSVPGSWRSTRRAPPASC
jgi:hypothetical protein